MDLRYTVNHHFFCCPGCRKGTERDSELGEVCVIHTPNFIKIKNNDAKSICWIQIEWPIRVGFLLLPGSHSNVKSLPPSPFHLTEAIDHDNYSLTTHLTIFQLLIQYGDMGEPGVHRKKQRSLNGAITASPCHRRPWSFHSGVSTQFSETLRQPTFLLPPRSEHTGSRYLVFLDVWWKCAGPRVDQRYGLSNGPRGLGWETLSYDDPEGRLHHNLPFCLLQNLRPHWKGMTFTSRLTENDTFTWDVCHTSRLSLDLSISFFSTSTFLNDSKLSTL